MPDLFVPSAVSHAPALAVMPGYVERLTSRRFEGASELSFIIQTPVFLDVRGHLLTKDFHYVCLCVSNEACTKDNNVRWELGSVVKGETCSGEMGHYSIRLHLDLLVNQIR